MFLNNKSILVMCNCIVSMTTHKAILKRGRGTYKNTHFLAATFARTLNLVFSKPKDMSLLHDGLICKFIQYECS